MNYPTVELKSSMDFDNIRIGVNGVTRTATGVSIQWERLEEYLLTDDYSNFIAELNDALAASDYYYQDEWKSYAGAPMRYALYPGLLNPDGKPGKWHFKGSDKKEHLTFLSFDPKTYKTVACTHYITYKAHKRLVREALLDIENLVKEQVERGVSEGIARAIADGTATLKQVQDEKQRLEEQLRQLDAAEQRIKAREAVEAQRQREKAERKANKTTAGYVYVLKQVGGTHYKIGHTSNPDKRKHTFDVKLPFAVEFDILLKTDDRYTLEAQLHAHFAAKRVQGEWFALDDNDLAYIKAQDNG